MPYKIMVKFKDGQVQPYGGHEYPALDGEMAVFHIMGTLAADPIAQSRGAKIVDATTGSEIAVDKHSQDYLNGITEGFIFSNLREEERTLPTSVAGDPLFVKDRKTIARMRVEADALMAVMTPTTNEFTYKRGYDQPRTDFIYEMLQEARSGTKPVKQRIAAVNAAAETAMTDKKALNGSRRTQRQINMFADFIISSRWVEGFDTIFGPLLLGSAVKAMARLADHQLNRGVVVSPALYEVMAKWKARSLNADLKLSTLAAMLMDENLR